MTITSHWVEPIDAEHHDKIIAVFHKLFIDKGGQADGWGDGPEVGDGDGSGHGYGYGDGGGDGYGDGRGNGWGDGGRCYVPEEWRVE